MTSQTAQNLLTNMEAHAALSADGGYALDVQGRYLEVEHRLDGGFAYAYGREPITRDVAAVVLANR